MIGSEGNFKDFPPGPDASGSYRRSNLALRLIETHAKRNRNSPRKHVSGAFFISLLWFLKEEPRVKVSSRNVQLKSVEGTDVDERVRDID